MRSPAGRTAGALRTYPAAPQTVNEAGPRPWKNRIPEFEEPRAECASPPSVAGCSARRPAHLPSPQQVQMDVRHGLSTVAAHVHHRPVATFGQALRAREVPGRE